MPGHLSSVAFRYVSQPAYRLGAISFLRSYMHLWVSEPNEGQPTPSESPHNTITLSEAFYKEIDEHGIPVEREVIAALVILG